MNRDANPKMNSPVDAFVGDIVGWNDVVNKKAKTISGVTANGNKLTIKLTQKDGGLIDKLAMPFFCAIDPAKTPVDPQGVKTLPGAGPYYIAARTVGKQLVMKVNPYYKGNRPHRAGTIVFTMNTDPQQTYLQVSKGTYATDPNGLDNPAAASQLAKTYGINKSASSSTRPPRRTTSRSTPRGPRSARSSVRKAANYAIDRPALLRAFGFGGGKTTTAILPPSLAGGVEVTNPYPLTAPNVAKAKSLAGGKCGNVQLWYGTGPVGTPQSGILSYDLKQMGCTVTTKPFQGYALFTAAGVKGAPYDAALAGWYQDYADGYDFFHILLDGRAIQSVEQQQLRVLQRAEREREDRCRQRRIGHEPGAVVGQARQLHDVELRAVGLHGQPEHSRLHRAEDRRLPLHPGVRRDGPRHAVSQVSARATNEPIASVNERRLVSQA